VDHRLTSGEITRGCRTIDNRAATPATVEDVEAKRRSAERENVNEQNEETREQALDVRVEQGVMTLTIDRPRSMNALRSIDKTEMAEIVEGIDDTVRVIVVRGSGSRAFCAGADIKELARHSVASGVASLQAEARLFDAFMKCPVPIIAGVSGYALGLGLVIACVSDIVLASSDAVFGMPEVRNAVPAGMQTQLLAGIMGLNRARYLLYTGARMTAHDAQAGGLVAEVLPDLAALGDRTAQLAQTVAALPKVGLTLQKRVVDSWIRHPFDANIDANLYLAASAFGDDTPRAEIDRFIASRTPSTEAHG